MLLVEDQAADARLIQAAFAGSGYGKFNVVWVVCLSNALEYLDSQDADVILVDLTLPDAEEGVEVYDRIAQAASNALIMVLSESNDDEFARQAVQRGAHDFLSKARVDGHWLPRALRYALECKSAREALQKQDAHFRAMNDDLPLGILVADRKGNCIGTNAAYQKMAGLTFDQTLAMGWSAAIHPQDRRRIIAAWCDEERVYAPIRDEVRFLRQDGSIAWGRINRTVLSAELAPKVFLQTIEDITAEKHAEIALREVENALYEEREFSRVVLNSIADAIMRTDDEGNVTYLNLMAEAMTGWSREEAVGFPLPKIFNVVDSVTGEPADNPVDRALEENRTLGPVMERVLVRRDGVESSIEDLAVPIHAVDGRVAGAVLIFHDVSQSRAMAMKMAHLAQHDFLTGLPNRALLAERLSQAMGLARRHNKQVALMFVDVDYFKHINDSLGHAIGDQLLQSVAKQLRACVRSTDTVCRQGGDEFVILLAEIEEIQDAEQVARKLLSAFDRAQIIDGHEVHATLSIGISVYPDDGDNLYSVMQNADIAMYHAKANGRNNYQFFNAEMNTRLIRRLVVEDGLRRALKEGEFVLYYQPKVDLNSGAVSGAEALIRWRDPQRGLVYPGYFVSIAEDCGLMVPIGKWVLREACRQIRAWLSGGFGVVPIAINISATELKHKGFLEEFERILRDSEVAPCYVELELNARVLAQNVDALAERLKVLRGMGVTLAIDAQSASSNDFQLVRGVRADTMKIDRSFVRDVTIDLENVGIVSEMIETGRSLKQRIVAEGVETEEQLALLRMMKCDEGQGYKFSQPLSSDEFTSLLKKTKQAPRP